MTIGTKSHLPVFLEILLIALFFLALFFSEGDINLCMYLSLISDCIPVFFIIRLKRLMSFSGDSLFLPLTTTPYSRGGRGLLLLIFAHIILDKINKGGGYFVWSLFCCVCLWRATYIHSYSFTWLGFKYPGAVSHRNKLT